jgi:hypothetical protein
MSWTLKVRWGYRMGSQAPVNEQFDTKAEGLTRAAEVLADGYTVSEPGVHYHYPAAAVRFVSLIEDAE